MTLAEQDGPAAIVSSQASVQDPLPSGCAHLEGLVSERLLAIVQTVPYDRLNGHVGE